MGSKATRQSFGETIAELGSEYTNIVVIDADLRKSTMTGIFASRFPDRSFDIGIAEGNLVGIGAGLALSGKVPFICSFACFLVGRYEQIRMSIAYTDANVKVVGTHSGIGIGEDGYSQMGVEDIATLRSLPNFIIIQPADDIETKKATQFLVTHTGPAYFRLTRQKLPDIFDTNYQFQFGKGVLLRDGSDVTILATGAVVSNALQAGEELSKKGIHARVINIHTIKPIDEELIIKCARETGKVVTVEDHSVIGGLGSAVCEVLSEQYPVKVKRIGVEKFGESGEYKELYEKYGLSAGRITKAVETFLKEK